MYRYKIINMEVSSVKYGLCEICNNHVSEVYHQIEEREFIPNKWTQLGCHNLFGHKECLLSLRKEQ